MTGLLPTSATAFPDGAALMRALRRGLAVSLGVAEIARGTASGVGLEVSPGHVRVEDAAAEPTAAGLDVRRLGMDVRIAVVSFGISGAGGDDPFADEAAGLSAALAVALRGHVAVQEGASVGVLHSAEPDGRPGFRRVEGEPDRYEVGYRAVLSWQTAAEPATAAAPFPALGGEPFPVSSSDAALDGWPVEVDL